MSTYYPYTAYRLQIQIDEARDVARRMYRAWMLSKSETDSMLIMLATARRQRNEARRRLEEAEQAVSVLSQHNSVLAADWVKATRERNDALAEIAEILRLSEKD